MFGWSISAARRDSRSNRSRKLSSSLSAAERSLRATLRPSRTCSARYTTLMPPRPSSFSSRYPATLVPILVGELIGDAATDEARLRPLPDRNSARDQLLAGGVRRPPHLKGGKVGP